MSEVKKQIFKENSKNKIPFPKNPSAKKKIKKTKIKTTARDIFLLEQLNGYGVLSTRQIQELIFKGINIKTVLRRLRLLKAGGFLLSSEGLSNGGLAWFLTKKGASLFHPSAYTKPINKNSLQHDVTVSSIRMRLESLNIVESWTPEHILKRKALKTLYSSEKSLYQIEDPPIVPDGLFVIKQKGKWEAVALELETSVKSVKRYRKIFSLYRKKQLLRLLWYVVLNKSFGEALLRLWHKYNDYAVCGFSYSTLEEVFKKGFKLPIPEETEGKEALRNSWERSQDRKRLGLWS